MRTKGTKKDLRKTPTLINPIQTGLWKDVMDREGAIMALTWFFNFRATKSPKMNLGTFLALKTT